MYAAAIYRIPRIIIFHFELKVHNGADKLRGVIYHSHFPSPTPSPMPNQRWGSPWKFQEPASTGANMKLSEEEKNGVEVNNEVQ